MNNPFLEKVKVVVGQEDNGSYWIGLAEAYLEDLELVPDDMALCEVSKERLYELEDAVAKGAEAQNELEQMYSDYM